MAQVSVISILGLAFGVFIGPAFSNPVQGQAAGQDDAERVYAGGGLTVTGQMLRHFARQHVEHCNRVSLDARCSQDLDVEPRGDGNVFLVECHGTFGYGTIQSAIDAAVDGDVVLVLPNDCTPEGWWFENIDFLGKAIRVQSANPSDPAVVDATVIASTAATPAVSFQTGETRESVLLGLTLINAHPTIAMAVKCVGTTPKFDRCRFPVVSASPGSYWPLISLANGRPQIIDCMFDATLAETTGPSAIKEFSLGTGAAPGIEIERCTFTAFGSRAVVLGSSIAFISHCTFSGNPGGAISISVGSGGNVSISDSTFSDNGSTAMLIDGPEYGGDMSVERCLFLRNSDAFDGGAVRLQSRTYTSRNYHFRECVFAENTSDRYGGAMSIELYHPVDSTVTLDRCDFVANSAAYSGGAVSLKDMKLDARRCRFAANRAAQGTAGALYVWLGSSYINNSVTLKSTEFIANSAYFPPCMAASQVPMSISNCMMRENYKTSSSNPRGPCVEGNTMTITSSVLWNNGYWLEFDPQASPMSQFAQALTNAHYSFIQNWPTNIESTNLGGDPGFSPLVLGTWTGEPAYQPDDAQTMFLDDNAAWLPDEHAGKYLRPDAAGYAQSLIVSNTSNTLSVWGDFAYLGGAGITYEIRDQHLTAESLCIDAGDPEFTTQPGDSDLDGDPRIINCRVDMGADEFPSEDNAPGDFDGDGTVGVEDIYGFVQTVLDPANADACRADVNRDGIANGLDVADFVGVLLDP